jgi:hypothetical protein
MNKRLYRRMMRNHGRALSTVLSSSDSTSARQAAQKYLDDYPVEEIIRLAWLAERGIAVAQPSPVDLLRARREKT